LVSGEGIKKLRKSGIEVVSGVCQQQGRELNKRFFTSMEKQRPYIILKWAQTADGFIARENFDSKWISNEFSRQLVHRWRTEEDAVLVGRATAAFDNPKLNVRAWTGRDPVRIVIDRFLKLNDGLHLFDGKQLTLCYNTKENHERSNISLVKVDETDFLKNLIEDLYKRKIQSVIIEGGTHTLSAFINAGLWDEARVFVSAKTFLKGIPAPDVQGKLVSEQNIMEDVLRIYHPIS
jgi:diaminohydroxyphosphoribosylaminopyrimidine deaminase/5-amino-6-(5-phosphoribosylamino)uracil reductase